MLVIGALAVAWLGIGTAGKSLEQITAEELRRRSLSVAAGEPCQESVAIVPPHQSDDSAAAPA